MFSDIAVTNVPLTVVTPTSNTMSLTVTTAPTTMTTSSSPEVSTISHVKLPRFWHNSPAQWFTHADAMFSNKRIRSDLSRVNHVLESLDEDGVRSITDLLGPDATYEAIRQRLVTTYSVPQATRLQRMVQPGGLGDRTPSRLLRDMRDLYPDGMSEATLLAFWMGKLPSPVCTVIAGLTGSAEFLAERADRVWEQCQSSEVSAIVPNHGSHESNINIRRTTSTSSSEQDTRFLALESAIHALTAQVASLATSQAAALSHRTNDRASRQQRDRSRSQSQPRPGDITAGWCYYHDRYGVDARKCRDPCTYSSATRKNP